MVYTLCFFFSSKCSLFHKSNILGSCFIHILYTGCAKIKKNNSGAKRIVEIYAVFLSLNKNGFLLNSLLKLYKCKNKSDSAFNKVTGYDMDDWGLIPG